MKTLTNRYTLPVLLFLALSILLAGGCGSNLGQSQGCPSGSYPANSTDKITGTADTTFVALSLLGAPFLSQTIFMTPITFTVTDISGVPRNNVCLSAYTGDTVVGAGTPIWYTDANYGTVLTGTGQFNSRTVATNDAGVAIFYWSSAVLPGGLTRTVSSPGPPVTYNAGKDQVGVSYLQVYSGTLSAIFNFKWTVQGEPAS